MTDFSDLRDGIIAVMNSSITVGDATAAIIALVEAHEAEEPDEVRNALAGLAAKLDELKACDLPVSSQTVEDACKLVADVRALFDRRDAALDKALRMPGLTVPLTVDAARAFEAYLSGN